MVKKGLSSDFQASPGGPGTPAGAGAVVAAAAALTSPAREEGKARLAEVPLHSIEVDIYIDR